MALCRSCIAGMATVGVTDLADVVSSQESGGDIVMWDDRSSSAGIRALWRRRRMHSVTPRLIDPEMTSWRRSLRHRF